MSRNNSSDPLLHRVANQPVVRLVAYYLIVIAGVLLVHYAWPNFPGLFPDESTVGTEFGSPISDASRGPWRVALDGVIAMAMAFLLMLPTSWIYIMTRRKRGYQQSLIHTTLLLPIVVSAVVILVKNSIALAFSLGGIVGAIAFRHRLQDTKDAVLVFVSIGVGVGCALQLFTLAAALSFCYNLVTLGLWWTDFGRVPAPLEGPPAEQRLEALQVKDEVGADPLVSRIDTLLLKSMNPDQLDVLLKRAGKRRRRIADDMDLPGGTPVAVDRREGRLRVVAASKALEDARRKLEPVLDQLAKQWSLEGVASEGDRTVAHYHIRFRKKHPAEEVIGSVKSAVGTDVETLELV